MRTAFICADCADPGDPGLGGLLHCGSDGEAGSGGPRPVRSARHHQHCGQPASDRRYPDCLRLRHAGDWLIKQEVNLRFRFDHFKERRRVAVGAGARCQVWTGCSVQRPGEC